MNTEIVKTKGIPLSMEDDFMEVTTIGGGKRLVLKTPLIDDLDYTDFVRDENGKMVLKNNTSN
ncbi:MAG: hypothetical protein H8E55_52595 [Pelagibacterales bacterium]|nr:hypothetical protein [Pelagibacterales bacterium]